MTGGTNSMTTVALQQQQQQPSNSAVPSRKKVDQRVRTLLENGVKTGHRSFIVMVGDRGKEQVSNLHYMLSKAQVAKRPTVLWCFKRELEFSSHRKKRMKQLKKTAKGLQREPGARMADDPFELFLTQTSISYCYYHETERILGNTFGMCVLQDFEALTPNLLARTIETVQGGGLVILLLKTLKSLKQLYTMTMDVHARYRTESVHHDPIARFNERFLLSLPTCPNCLVVNDLLDVLPVTGMAAREIRPVSGVGGERNALLEGHKLGLLKELPSSAVSKLVDCTKTMDQATVVQSLVEVLLTQPLRTTISVTAGRGRGKSAALGLGLAAAFSAGYANVFITSPSPENLKTLFEFLFRGLDALGYEEHLDYDIVQSTQPELSRCIVRVNVHRSQQQHRQTLLYIHPEDTHLLGQAELVVIDEAAAIPLPLVQALTTGPQTVLMASTINGYEGTGRSLSHKLLADLRKPGASRTLKELSLEEPIRYASGDVVELWLNRLLCLDVTGGSALSTSTVKTSLPHPESCQLYLINRDTLFSFHKAAEAFLQRLIGLHVASHYKNSPNDLQLMSDAPGHLLFVLLPPGADSPSSSATAGLPDILCFAQVCLEGQLSKQSILNSLARGKRAAGDLIPWTVSQQFQDDDFAQLSGARIVRIAVNPECQRMGYGGRTMNLLERFFRAELLAVEDPVDHEEHLSVPESTDEDLLTESIKPRSNLRPLLTRLDQVRPLPLHWLGVSFGLTAELWQFYKRLGYRPLYLRQTTNDITGEHTIIVLKQLLDDASGVNCTKNWLASFNTDFTRRFISLLSFSLFRKLSVRMCLSLTEGVMLSDDTLAYRPSPFDVKRLESYANNLLDYHMILDMLPDMSRQFFLQSFSLFSLSPVQSAILLGVGLQRKTVDDLGRELKLPVSQVLAMLSKGIRKFVAFYRRERLVELEEATPTDRLADTMEQPLAQPSPAALPVLDEELDEAAGDAMKMLKRKQRELVDSLDLAQFEIPAGKESEWSEELGRKSHNLENITVEHQWC